MREPLEIIAGIRDYIRTQQPFRFHNLEEVVLNDLTELENSLTPIIEVSIAVVEQPIIESLTIETTLEKPTEIPPVEPMLPPDGTGIVSAMDIIEPPTENVARPKRNTKKK